MNRESYADFLRRCGASDDEIKAKLDAIPQEAVSDATGFVEEAPVKKDFGYKPIPLADNVFLKPLPKEHPGRLLFPPAYEPASDIAFVHCTGPEAVTVNPGDLVLFDKFAEVGNRFELVNDEGVVEEMIRIQLPFIYAVLKRVNL